MRSGDKGREIERGATGIYDRGMSNHKKEYVVSRSCRRNKTSSILLSCSVLPYLCSAKAAFLHHLTHKISKSPIEFWVKSGRTTKAQVSLHIHTV